MSNGQQTIAQLLTSAARLTVNGEQMALAEDLTRSAVELFELQRTHDIALAKARTALERAAAGGSR